MANGSEPKPNKITALTLSLGDGTTKLYSALIWFHHL